MVESYFFINKVFFSLSWYYKYINNNLIFFLIISIGNTKNSLKNIKRRKIKHEK